MAYALYKKQRKAAQITAGTTIGGAGLLIGGGMAANSASSKNYEIDRGFYGHPKAGKADKFYKGVQNCTGY